MMHVSLCATGGRCPTSKLFFPRLNCATCSAFSSVCNFESLMDVYFWQEQTFAVSF